jgi:uncharacterized protein (DUF58 family)
MNMMNAPWFGWALAVLAVAAGYVSYGWRGVLLAVTVIVFWLLLQLSRTLRTLRMAAGSPVGRVGSAVMLHSRLKPGLRLVDVIGMTRSLGERVSESPEVWRWRDDGGATLILEFDGARLAQWRLERDS